MSTSVVNGVHELGSLLVAPVDQLRDGQPRSSNTLPSLSAASLALPSTSIATLSIPAINQIPATPVPLPSNGTSQNAPSNATVALQEFDIDSDDYVEEAASASEWGDLIQEAESSYSQSEIDGLMAELREIGMVHFIRKYCVDQAVPPRKLLMGFGVLVVSPCV
jgi:hypothetical protein